MDKDFCAYCHADLTDSRKLVTVYRHRKGQHFIFERVPARACSRCGERCFSAQVVREMDELMKKPEPQAALITVPVMALHT